MNNGDVTYDQYPASAQPYGTQSAGEPPVGEPYFGVGFGKSLKRFLAGYVKFDGRASRAEYWWSYLWMQIILLIPILIYVIGATVVAFSFSFQMAYASQMSPDMALQMMLGMFAWAIPLVLVSLALTLPSYAIMWRRLHDAGFSGALALLSLIGLSIIPTIMCIMPTSPEALKYGPGAVPQQHPQYPPQYQGQYPQQYPPQQY